MEEQLFQGIDSLYQGTSTLYENLDEFPAGLQALLEGQIALRNGMEEATSMLNTEENASENISFASEQGSASSSTICNEYTIHRSGYDSIYGTSRGRN